MLERVIGGIFESCDVGRSVSDGDDGGGDAGGASKTEVSVFGLMDARERNILRKKWGGNWRLRIFLKLYLGLRFEVLGRLR